MAGFTMFELLIVMAFIAIIGSVGIGYYFNYQRQTILRTTADNIQSFLYITQQRSIGQEDASQWGVHFENPAGGNKPFYASFKGATYTAPVETRFLDAALDFAYPAEGESVDIVFNRINGKVADGVHKKVYVSLNPGAAVRGINISPFGVITMNDGEVGWWRMDEGSGATTGDSSGYTNQGSFVGAPTWQSEANCKSGNCLSFAGTGDRVNVGYNEIFDIREAITISVWMKRTTGFNQLTDFFILSRPPAWYFYDAYNSGQVRGEVFIDGVRRGNRTTSVPFDGNWYHVVYTYDSNSRYSRIYNNGKLSSATQLTGLSNYLIDHSTVNFTGIGQASVLGRGIILDDLRIYDRALSSDEVKHLYETTK
jgi:type II secretory pathway pseudopilin PulG